MIDRLEAAGLVRREPNPQDGRGTLAVITDDGRAVATKATADLNNARFGMGALDRDGLAQVFELLRQLRLDSRGLHGLTLRGHVWLRSARLPVTSAVVAFDEVRYALTMML